MWEADIVLTGLGTQAALCYINDSCTFQRWECFYKHNTLLAKLICMYSRSQIPSVMCGATQ